ncbi:MAG: HD domain-containing protein [Clostridia bacterium]|nr:HD domain-containing protein [Clostridia bacterium]
MAKKQVAVIDIGSSYIRMKIFEDKKSSIKELEHLEMPLYLGHDTFKDGQISFQRVDKLCDILNSYKKLANSYGLNKVHTYATTAFREALNKEYVIELVKLRTGIDIAILDDLEEKTMIYQEIKRILNGKIKNGVMTYVGSGSLGIAVVEKGLIKYSQNIRIGSLKLSEILEPVQGYTKKFHVIVEQYINTFIDVLGNFVKITKQNEFIATGKEISIIGKILGEQQGKRQFKISRNTYNNLYDTIKQLTSEQISEKHSISLELAETLIPSMAMFKILMDFSSADSFVGYDISLCDFIGFKELHPNKFKELTASFYEDVMNQARYIALRFSYDKNHAAAVLDYSLKIFDSIKEIHGLNDRHRLLLSVSCILHDTGKFLNLKSHYQHSYNVIRNLEIAGLSNEELEIIANISKYHSDFSPSIYDDNYKELSLENRMLVSKLSAIIKLGDSLDKSHLQKFSNLNIDFKENVLKVNCTFKEDITLEEWAFENKSVFFNNVYGIKALLLKERLM